LVIILLWERLFFCCLLLPGSEAQIAAAIEQLNGTAHYPGAKHPLKVLTIYNSTTPKAAAFYLAAAHRSSKLFFFLFLSFPLLFVALRTQATHTHTHSRWNVLLICFPLFNIQLFICLLV